ncbi:MAG: hypothetical protein HC896_15020, partial [Bacteroidales bacterium]|nr:hypothetical protein [Bacteroidales bacterium]
TFCIARLQYAIAIYPPPPPTLVLHHEDNNDMCEALITDRKSFDLTNLQVLGQHQVKFILTSTDGAYSETFLYKY